MRKLIMIKKSRRKYIFKRRRSRYMRSVFSPDLTIYRSQVNSLTSILSRVSGFILFFYFFFFFVVLFFDSFFYLGFFSEYGDFLIALGLNLFFLVCFYHFFHGFFKIYIVHQTYELSQFAGFIKFLFLSFIVFVFFLLFL